MPGFRLIGNLFVQPDRMGKVNSMIVKKWQLSSAIIKHFFDCALICRPPYGAMMFEKTFGLMRKQASI